MKEIPLTQGKVALVDDCDYDELSRYKWYAHHDKRSDIWYAERCSGARRAIKMHRQILGLTKGDGKLVDHWNHNGLDNQRHNLRPCTRTENQRNQKIQTTGHKASKYKGVFRVRGKWQSAITINKQLTTLGLFVDEEEAARAYDQAAIQHFGQFAYLNFPLDTP